ncbi:MAG: hypothetical protein ABSD58_02365 [Verrucomicrobiia bacterium]|jgi:hypothetical protein
MQITRRKFLGHSAIGVSSLRLRAACLAGADDTERFDPDEILSPGRTVKPSPKRKIVVEFV